MTWLRFPLGLALGLIASLAVADDTGLTSLQTGDAVRGWEAVGRIDFANDSFCTGTLIDTATVITAAHCLYDDAGGIYPASVIEFRAGLRNGRPEATRGVSRAAIHPRYDRNERDPAVQVRYDIAVLRLSQPIRTSTIEPMTFARSATNNPTVGLVSYAEDRAEAPSLQERCTVLAVERGVIITSCSVNFGASGAPIFRLDGGRPYLVSVVSAMADIEGRPVSMGADLMAPMDEVLALLSAPTGIDTGNPGARMIRPGDRGDTGALFVRP